MLLCPRDSPGKSTRVGCHFLLQGIFLTQGSNPCLQHCKWILYCLSSQENPRKDEFSLKNNEMKKTSRCVDLWLCPWLGSITPMCLETPQKPGHLQAAESGNQGCAQPAGWDKPSRGRWCPPTVGLRSSPLCFAISHSVANLTFQPKLTFRLVLLNEGPCSGRTVSHLKQRFCVS